MANDPYTRIYHKLADEYPDVYDDKAMLGAYVQLLIAADQAWPSRARWAGYADEDEMACLEKEGLVLRDGKRYSIKGLDKERKSRSSHARKAARARYDQPSEQEASTALSNARSIAQTMPSRAEPSRAEPSRDEPSQTKTNRTARDKSRGLTSLRDVLGERV